MSGRVRFNPLAPGFLADPYPDYRRLRDEDPVHWSVTGSWVLTRHDDIKAVLTDERFLTVDTPERITRRGRRFDRSGPNLDHLERLLRGVFIFADPPVHGQLAKVARAGFGGIGPEGMSRIIAAVISELIADLSRKPEADLVGEFAEPLACRTIGRIMGMADADAERLQHSSQKIGLVLDSMRPLEDYREMNDAAGELLDHFEKVMASDGGNENTFWGRMRTAAVANGATDMLPSLAAGLFFAGQETTINAASNAIYLIAGNADFRTRLLSGAATGVNWVHELLRYESPVQLTAREAATDVELRGRLIKAGQRVVLYLGAANRDPAVFADPDRLDFERDPRAHLAFSAGLHRCIGAHLATEELRQGLSALFQRFPSLRPLNPQPAWRKNVTIRGHWRLPVELGPSANNATITRAGRPME
jgi:pimeloyl-[acyl-carrier protein] synthase